MVKLNPFYYGLVSLQTKPRHEYLEAKTTTDGNAYILIQIPTREQQCVKIMGTTYKILSHHLSIYDDYRLFARNSDAHYTAQLAPVDGEGVYNLHVYFDEKDRCIGSPSLCKMAIKSTKSRQGQRKKILKETDFLEMSEVDALEISALALSISTPILAGLRQQHQQDIARIENQLNQWIANFNMPSTIEECTRCLHTLEEHLHHALLLNNQSFHLVLYSLKQDVFWMEAELTQASCFATLNALRTSQAPTQALVIPKDVIAPNTTKVKTGKVQSRHPDARALEEALQHMNACKIHYETKAKGAKALNALLTYFESIQDAHAQIDDTKHTKASSTIKKALWSTQLLCASRLVEALETNHVANCERLKGFARFLSDLEVIRAVERNDAQALSVLLENGVFPLNRIQWMPEGDSKAATLLEYTYEKGYSACFEVLLTHGASVLTHVMHPLPLADRIMFSGSSPFLRIFDTEFNGTKRTSLLSALCHVLRSPEYEQDSSIIERINFYELRIQQIKCLSTSFFKSSKACASQVSGDLARMRLSLKEHKVEEMILASPELQALQSRSLKAYADYYAKLSKAEQMLDRSRSAKFMTALADQIESTNNDSITSLALQQSMTKHYVDTIDFYEMSTERLLISEQLKTFKVSGLNRHQVKEYRRLCAQLNQLTQDIESKSISIEKIESELKKQEKFKFALQQFEDIWSDLSSALSATSVSALSEHSLFSAGESLSAVFDTFLRQYGPIDGLKDGAADGLSEGLTRLK